MQPREFADEIFRLWPKAFQPQETWHAEIVGAVTEFSVAQLSGALSTLKFKRAGRAIDLGVIVEACRSATAVTALPGHNLTAAFKRQPGDDIPAFLNWMRARGLIKAYGRLPMVEKVMISRLCAVLWGGSHWEREADEIAGEGQDFQKLARLNARASEMVECRSPDHGGWFPPWADKTQGRA